MFQKIVVVLVGLVMSIIGALAPSGLFAAETQGDGLPTATGAKDQVLATVRAADSSAFAKVSALWIEVDGKRVTEDAWGTGEVSELRFQVGVKEVDGMSLAVGEKLVPLHPTDVITVRMFQGDFAYRGIKTGEMTLQLQGTVKTTTLNEGGATGKVTTALGGVSAPQDAARPEVKRPGAIDRVSYVVLDTGETLDTVAVQVGGNRVLTQDIETVRPNEVGNLLVKWVKIDGKAVREYTWGNGQVGRIEFEPVSGAPDAPAVKFGTDRISTPQSEQVHVDGFVGEYLVYQVTGGFLRLRLDGYAQSITTGDAGTLPVALGDGVPIAQFEAGPEIAKTTTVIQLKDRSVDEGIIVFWHWDFGDGTSAALQDPTHRYVKPGIYNVTLTVTDDDLNTASTTRTLIVRNADPLADFEFLPRIVTTDILVQLTDRSADTDGYITNWTWRFGDDDSVSYARHPSHRFTRGGQVDVSLTVTDDLGGRTTLVKKVLVRNAPPVASFDLNPKTFLAGTPVVFKSTSFDKDGDITLLEWTFSDRKDKGIHAIGPDVTHVFKVPGRYTVSLTATDDLGDSDTVALQVEVLNKAPIPSFTAAVGETDESGTPVEFTSRSTDEDGFILYNEWTWGDGKDNITIERARGRCVDMAGGVPPSPEECLAAAQDFVNYGLFRVDSNDASTNPPTDPPLYAPPAPVEHQYDSKGAYTVKLCVTDNLLAKSCTSNDFVQINNTPPRVEILITQAGAQTVNLFRQQDAFFSYNRNTDPDGDALTVVGWEFSDLFTSTSEIVTRQFRVRGDYWVKLTLEDSDGARTTGHMDFTVINAAPIPDMTITNVAPRLGELIWINGTFLDPDMSPGETGVVWTLKDAEGGTRTISTDLTLELSFEVLGQTSVNLKVTDGEGASGDVTRTINILPGLPEAGFSWVPTVPNANETVQFVDETFTHNPPITEWTWDFGDNSPPFVTTNAAQSNPQHVYTQPGDYTATLTVEDARGASTASHVVHVNFPPLASFLHVVNSATPGSPTVTFTDTSVDTDGTLVERVWDFGDGTTIATSDLVVNHTYGTPGTKTVKLTVFDDAGGSDDFVAAVHISNHIPVAGFLVLTENPMANAPVQFSSALSFDVDGNHTLAFWRWEFGDGTVLEGTDSGIHANPAHVYAASGFYRVTLTVGDGIERSNPVTKTVRIAADHDLLIAIRAKLPNGHFTPVMGNSHIETDLTITGPFAAAIHQNEADLQPWPEGGLYRVAAGLWAAGDVARVSLRDDRMLGVSPIVQLLTPLKNEYGTPGPTGTIIPVLDFLIPMPMTAVVTPLSPEDRGLLNSDAYTESGDPIYHDMSRPFFGRGNVMFANGDPAAGAQITVELRLLALYTPFGGDPMRDRVTTPDNDLLGWCRAGTAVADEDGDFAWEVKDPSCILPSECAVFGSECLVEKDGVFVMGHWDVRAVARFDGAPPTISAAKSIFVDPTGVFVTGDHAYLRDRARSVPEAASPGGHGPPGMRLAVLLAAASLLGLPSVLAEDTCTSSLCHERSSQTMGEGTCGSALAYERERHDWTNLTLGEREASLHVAYGCGATSSPDAAERHSALLVEASAAERSAELRHSGQTGYDADGNNNTCSTTLHVQRANGATSDRAFPCVRASLLPADVLP